MQLAEITRIKYIFKNEYSLFVFKIPVKIEIARLQFFLKQNIQPILNKCLDQ